MKFLNNKGDTIIEVLIAIAVVGSVLAGAYISSNASLNASRDAQERSQALKLVESQLERLKFVVAQGSVAALSSNNIFCIDSSNTLRDANSPTTYTPISSLNNDDFTKYTASCRDTSSGPTYYLSIERSATDPNFFAVRARWDRIGSGGRDEVTINYRTYQ